MATPGVGLVGFCGRPPYCDPKEQTDAQCCPEGAGAAVVLRELVWKGRQVLKVYFLNPDVLTGWGLLPDTIIEWANAWDEVMVFKITTKTDKADIRVEFSESEGSWSVLGMCAEKVTKPKPTMMLNLKKDSPNKEAQRSLVIHEFGHALGLEHEHQRSDFWDGVEKHIDMDKMRDDCRVKQPIADQGVAAFGSGWFEKPDGVISTIRRFLGIPKKTNDSVVKSVEYDPDSIMHFAFDKDWIKTVDYRDIRHLRRVSDEDLPEKKYLIGIVHRNNTLAKNPSKIDLHELGKAYGKK